LDDPSATDQITRVLAEIERGDGGATERLFPLVYGELRRLAGARMAAEPEGMTLQPTALVHEVYLRLAGETGAAWEGRAHFFAAAAEAMRRILVERARRRGRLKRGGGRAREPLCDPEETGGIDSVDLIELNEALDRLAASDARLAQVVSLRFFAGLSVEQTGDVLGISGRTIKRDWEFARAWLFDSMRGRGAEEPA
jgi:RNA polymerase sigma factor (TIGR02999 family)